MTWWMCNMLRLHVRQRRGNLAFTRSHYSYPTVMVLNSPWSTTSQQWFIHEIKTGGQLLTVFEHQIIAFCVSYNDCWIGGLDDWWLILWIHKWEKLSNHLWEAQKPIRVWTQYIPNRHNTVICLRDTVGVLPKKLQEAFRNWTTSLTGLYFTELTWQRSRQKAKWAGCLWEWMPWPEVNRNEGTLRK